MAFIEVGARVAETSVTTGTGPLALAAAVDASYQRFSAVATTNDTLPYWIVSDSNAWESGIGTYSAANELTRTTVKYSSNSNNPVSFTGALTVFLGYPGMANLIAAATAKATPIDADKLGYWDSVTGLLRSMTWANLKTAVYTGFGALIAAGSLKSTPTGADRIVVSDSEDSDATKRVSLTSLVTWLGETFGTKGITLTSKSAAYTFVLGDAGQGFLHPAADTTARIWTIPANSSVAYAVGTPLTFVNQNAAGVITLSITTDTMRLAGAGTTGSRTLAANGIATALKITSTEWIISGTGLT